MLKHRAVRGILMHNGINTIEELSGVTMVSGTTDGTIYFYYEGDYDYANWATNSPVVVISDTTSLSIATGFTLDAYTISGYSLTVLNQASANVTSNCTYTSSNTGVTTVGASTGVLTLINTGTSTVSITHVDGASATTLITVTGSVISSLSVYSGSTLVTGGTHLTGSTFTFTIKDQIGNNVTQYTTMTTNAYATFVPSTGVMTFGSSTGSTTLTFNYALRSKTITYAATIS